MNVFCERCGKANDANARYCEDCGAFLHGIAPSIGKPANAPTIPSGPCAALDMCLRRYATFRGRASRSEYWLFTLIFSFFWCASALYWRGLPELCNAIMWNGADVAAEVLPGYLPRFVAWTGAWAALWLPMLAVSARRLRDAGFSAFHLAWFCATTVGAIWCVIWCVWARESGSIFEDEIGEAFVLTIYCISCIVYIVSQAVFGILCLCPSTADETKYGPRPTKAASRR